MGAAVYVIATMDSKGHEAAFVAEQVRRLGVSAVTVDVGTHDQSSVAPDLERARVLSFYPGQAPPELRTLDRGQAVGTMSEALVGFLTSEYATGKIAGVIGLGGSGGTALIAPAMRALPIGLPKLLVSTVASGNTAPYVGCSDILMLYSVVDVAGINAVSRQVLSNAAHAMAGMVAHRLSGGSDKPALGMTMFGVTTPCVTAVRQALEARGFDCLVFHATGTGGQAMEKLVESGLLRAVLDITTTEVADEVVGGVFRAGPNRFDAIIRAGVPCVMSVGAMDMVNFGAIETVPGTFRQRRLHVHNSQVTLMRTTAEENRRCAQWIAAKVCKATGPLVILLPERGVSALDALGQPFFDPEADEALFSELEQLLPPNATRQLRRLPCHINDAMFADALLDAFDSVWRLCRFQKKEELSHDV